MPKARDVAVWAVPMGSFLQEKHRFDAPSRRAAISVRLRNMLQMAAFSGVAIALHNFPEGADQPGLHWMSEEYCVTYRPRVGTSPLSCRPTEHGYEIVMNHALILPLRYKVFLFRIFCNSQSFVEKAVNLEPTSQVLYALSHLAAK